MNNEQPPCDCPAGTHHECSICLELMCPGHLQSGTTVCSKCNELHKDEQRPSFPLIRKNAYMPDHSGRAL